MNTAIQTYLNAVRALADVIQELGEVPSGHLYASVMGSIQLHQYERMIDTLVGSGIVKRSGHLLVWNVEAAAAA